MTDLGSLEDGHDAFAYEVNGRGQVVGRITETAGTYAGPEPPSSVRTV